MDDLERTLEEAAYRNVNTHYPKLIAAFNDFFERGYAPVQVIEESAKNLGVGPRLSFPRKARLHMPPDFLADSFPRRPLKTWGWVEVSFSK
jgi:hypothetical protein